MRKKLSLFLLALITGAGTMFASNTQVDGIYYDFDSSTKTASVTFRGSYYNSYDNEYSGSVVIPSSVTYNAVTYSVTSIGENAFSVCSGLTSVTIPSSVTSIGESAFSACSSLTSVHISDIAAWCAIYFGGIYGERTNPLSYAHNLYLNNELVTDLIIPNTVTRIGRCAFDGCSCLTSVVIPNSVTSIAYAAFRGCSGLTSVTIPNSVTSIDGWVFDRCSGLTSVNIPSSVTKIEWYAFCACTGLTSVTIPNSVTSIGSSAFSSCTSLTSVLIGNNVTSIGDFAFSGCKSLTSIVWNAKHCADFTSTSTPFYLNTSYDIRSQITSFVFGDEVEYIPAYLCAGMSNAEITIENCKTEIGAHAFDDCNYTQEGIYNIVLPDTTLCYHEDLIIDGVKCPLNKKANEQQTWTQNLKTKEGCDSIITISVLWKKLPDFSITTKDVFDTPSSGSITYKKNQSANYNGDYYYTLNGVKNASCSNLSAGNYRLVFYGEECGDSIVKNITINQYGMKVNGMYYLLDENYHTAKVTFRGTSYDDYNGEYSGNITIPKKITFDGKEYKVTGIGIVAFYGCNNISSITMESETPISMYMSGLSSNCVIYVPYGALNAYESASGWRNYTIHVINPSHVTSTAGATSATITLGNTNEAQHIASCGMDGGVEEFAGNVIEYIGLEPNSEYANIPLFIKTKEGDIDNTIVSFTTTALELTTKPSKPVSATTAILLAETNMSDAEVSCGFEYKRNDAPEDMAGTKVFCPVASGQMAGRLKNLKDDVYYKYRAFYQSSAGNMYYGDWQYIFTGDVAVEFDPILYTYGATVVRENEATISGYALAGSEDFTEQGFEYWAETRANGGTNAPRRMPAGLNEHFFVQASGIALRATLTDLDAGTVYKYRVYGKVGDQYYYGSEQSFTTQGEYKGDDTEAIEDVQIDNTQNTKAQKFLHNGQIYILRGEKVYTVTGQVVK